VIQTLGPTFKVEFCPDGRSLLTVSSREARLVDLEQFLHTVARTELAMDEIPSPMADMRVYGVPTHRDRVFGNSEWIWNVDSGHSALSLGEKRFLIRSRYAAMDPGGEWLATMDPYGTGAKVRDVPDGALLAEVGVTSLIDLAADPRGRYLALADQQRTIRLVDTSTWTLARVLNAPEPADDEVERPYYFSQIAFSPDGRHLAAAAISDGVLLWDVESGELMQHWISASPREEAGLCLAFSPDGRMLASGGSRNVAMIWDVETGERLSTLAGHGRTLYHLAFSPDGQRIVTCSRDRTVRLWEVASGREVMILDQSEEIPVAAAFNRDGRTLAIAYASGNGRILDSFPVNVETIEGAEQLSEAERFELWKRRTRTGRDINGSLLSSPAAITADSTTASPERKEAGGESMASRRE
jgi:WD40 repeat protein